TIRAGPHSLLPGSAGRAVSDTASVREHVRRAWLAQARFQFPPVRFRLAAAPFHIRPVSDELSEISRPLAGVRVRLPPARARVPTVRRPLPAMSFHLPPARAGSRPSGDHSRR